MSFAPAFVQVGGTTLIDLSSHLASQLNWNCPFYCTQSVWDLLDDAVKQRGQSLHCLIQVISVRIKNAAANHLGDETVIFRVIIGDSWRRLKARHIPANGCRSPVTVMLAREI
jgi:hypothetical protein